MTLFLLFYFDQPMCLATSIDECRHFIAMSDAPALTEWSYVKTKPGERIRLGDRVWFG